MKRNDSMINITNVNGFLQERQFLKFWMFIDKLNSSGDPVVEVTALTE